MQAPARASGANGAGKGLSELDVDMDSDPAGFAGGADGLPSAPDSGAAHDQRRSGRTRTVRVRDGFFDSSLLHYVALDDAAAGTAAAGAAAGAGGGSGAAARDEALPGRRSPLPAATAARPSTRQTPAADFDYEEDDRPVGPKFQATNIPAWRPRPAQPTAAEAKFLPAAPLYPPAKAAAAVAAAQPTNSKTRAGRAGVSVPMPPVGIAASSSDFRYKYRWAKDSAGRRKLLHAAVNALDKQLGPHMVKVLGLEGVGFKYAATWQPHEELLFCLGMCDKYRMFKYIRQCFLFSRSAHELNGYYHNVWKTRSTDLADEFLTLRDEEATREEFMIFVDKVRDRLTAMWDRKVMGDMPKILKDISAAARAAPAKERNKRRELLSSSEEEEVEEEASEEASDSSTETADDSDSDRRARSRQKQRKRGAGAAGGGRAAKRPRDPYAQPYRNKRGRPPGGSAAQQQWAAYSGQRARSSGRAAQQGVLFKAPRMNLPDMPTLPRPDVRNQAAIAGWLKALPDFKAALSSYVDAVGSMTDTAIEDCQSYISHLQEQRGQVKEQAEAYLKTLLAQGQEVLRAMTGELQLQQQQVQPPPHCQLMQQQQVAVKQEQAPAAGYNNNNNNNNNSSSRPPSAASGSMQQQQQADAGAVPDVMPSFKDGSSAQQQQAQEREGASDSRQQQQDQQPLPLPQHVTTAVDTSSPLPFPGGPLSKWLKPPPAGPQQRPAS